MFTYINTAWVIMSKDRQWIAKGVPRARYLVRVDDTSDTKRILTYSTKGRADAGYRTSGFFGGPVEINRVGRKEFLEPVKVSVVMQEVDNGN